MIVLDTNIVSEALKADMDVAVARWFDQQSGISLFLTCVTQSELLVGIGLLPQSKRRGALGEAVNGLFADFDGRILPFDSFAASHYADILVARRAVGRPISQFDCQIAAITRSRGARLATRDVGDFQHCGIDLINPFEPS